ncbi:hypothetical protein OF83DRAFT_61676 [Amylostereum chailletii]|nr:hypothetical protein OF83DRAFT_61676 [Amylostereum chailletii]
MAYTFPAPTSFLAQVTSSPGPQFTSFGTPPSTPFPQHTDSSPPYQHFQMGTADQHSNLSSSTTTTPARSSTPSSTSTAAAPGQSMSDAILTRVKTWCDAVAAKHDLQPAQYGNLHTMIEIGRKLDVDDLRLRLINQITLYQVQNKIDQQETDYKKFQAILEDLCQRLATKFELNKDQHDALIRLAKDMAFQPTRTSRHGIALDLEAHVKHNASKLGFENVFGDSKREQVLRKACKKRAGNARTQFRGGLIDSIDTKKCNLEKATYELATKLRAGGVLNLKFSHQLMISVMRRFVSENLTELRPLDGEDSSSDEETTATAPPAKRPKRNGGSVGKVRKGEDFWGRMDTYIQAKMGQYGPDLTSEKWRSFIQETVKKDIAQFGRGSGNLLQSLPVIYTSPTPVQTAVSQSINVPVNEAAVLTQPATGDGLNGAVAAAANAGSQHPSYNPTSQLDLAF